MKLNENLRMCLLALASRYPDSSITFNEESVGTQSRQADGYTPDGVIELLQSNAPHQGVSLLHN